MNEIPLQPMPQPTDGQPSPVVALPSLGGAPAPAPPQSQTPLPSLTSPQQAPLDVGEPIDEMAWIDAAKQVISSTQNDPYLQAEQLYKLRVQFMKRIHQRDLKPKETNA